MADTDPSRGEGGELLAYARPRTEPAHSGRASIGSIFNYATGDGVNSLVMNSIFGFSMLYYTKALGLSSEMAGWAMAIATLWDAITDPIMGHITDNTRSRYGRRHPYMLVGGLLTAVCFYFIWAVPETFREPTYLFFYLIAINLLLRTTITVFLVSYAALGFEVCTDYTQRTTLQGVRMAFNMFINLIGPALSWSIFFKDNPDVESTTVPENFVRMGTVFSVAVVAVVLYVTYTTRKYAVDTRHQTDYVGLSLGHIFTNLKDILLDPVPRRVFVFIGIIMIGMVFVAQTQMFVYVDFMHLASVERTIVHGGTMVGCGLGALLSGLLVSRLDKKPSIYLSAIAGALANVVLILLFVTGWVEPGWKLGLAGLSLPVATILFALFHATYWAGNGSLSSIAGSMMADASEICKYERGVLKDGGYAAMLAFVSKTSLSIGSLMSGYCLKWVGYNEALKVQEPAVVYRLTAVCFISGSVLALLALVALTGYRINRAYMMEIKAALAARGDVPAEV